MTDDLWNPAAAGELPVTPHRKQAPHRKPERKVAASGQAGGASVVLVWLAAQLGLDMPAEVAAGLVGLAMFAAGYIKRG